MSKQHPLTDQIIEEIAEDVFYYDHSIPIFRCDMRAAYDLGRAEQLENVIDAWDDALQEEAECGVKFHSEKRSADMKHAYPVLTSFGAVLDAMRPTTQEES